MATPRRHAPRHDRLARRPPRRPDGPHRRHPRHHRAPTAPKPWYGASREAYAAGHIPGAVFVDWLHDVVDPAAPVKMTLARADQFAALMERLGMGDGHTVIVYDDNGHIAPRLWWALHYYGHPAVRVLDGGFGKWVAEGRPVSGRPCRATRRRRSPSGSSRSGEPARTRCGAGCGDPGLVLVDCRSPAEFRGRDRAGATGWAGSPGAVNLPVGSLMEGEHKTWRSDAELRRLFEAAGVTAERDVVTYCNAGVSASIGLFGLKLLGVPRVAQLRRLLVRVGARSRRIPRQPADAPADRATMSPAWPT